MVDRYIVLYHMLVCACSFMLDFVFVNGNHVVYHSMRNNYWHYFYNVTIISTHADYNTHTLWSLFYVHHDAMAHSGYIEPGLAMWTQDSGIQPFPGGGLSFIQPIGDERYIIHLLQHTYVLIILLVYAVVKYNRLIGILSPGVVCLTSPLYICRCHAIICVMLLLLSSLQWYCIRWRSN
jgi:hypothetical protein